MPYILTSTKKHELIILNIRKHQRQVYCLSHPKDEIFFYPILFPPRIPNFIFQTQEILPTELIDKQFTKIIHRKIIMRPKIV